MRTLSVAVVLLLVSSPALRSQETLRITPFINDNHVVVSFELNDAYTHFFFHYTATPLLVVETSQFDLSWGDEAIDDLLKQIKSMTRGTRYYVPRTG